MIQLFDVFSQKLNNFLRSFTKILLVLSCASMMFMFTVILVEVFGRTFFDAPLHGAIELVEIGMALTCFLMFAYIQVNDRNINVEMIYRRFSEKTKVLFDVFSALLATGFTFLLGYYLVLMAHEKFLYQEATPIYSIPIWISIGICAFAFALFVLANFNTLLLALVRALKQKAGIGLVLVFIITAALVYMPFYLKGAGLGSSRLLLGSLGMLYLFCLIFLSVPIGISMMVVGIQGLIILMPKLSIALNMACNAPYPQLAYYVISVIPMFILLGELALLSKISSDLFRAAACWFGRLPGGLAIASVVGCAGFAAVCGESLPTALTMTSVALPEMRKNNYNPAFGCACLALGGTLGILIPPSVGFIIYSIITEVSVASLFMAGILPGILLVVIISLMVVMRVKLNPSLAPQGPVITMKEKIRSLWGIIPMLGIFILIIGSIMAGFCTPTEGGALGALGTALYAMCKKSISLTTAKHAIVETALLTGKVTLIMIGVAILGYFLTSTRLPMMLAELVVEMETSRYVVLAAVIALFIFMGCVMNVLPMIMLIMPAVFPTLMALGFDPVWLGVITVLLMELGQITPPMGLLVFAMSGAVPDVPVEQMFYQIAPFFLAILACILLVVVFPQIALFLPHALL